MPRRSALVSLFPFIFLLLLLACGRGAAARLEGKWKGTFVEGVPPEAQSAAMAFARSMQIEVKGDAITVTVGQDRKEGRLFIDSEEGNFITLHTDRDGPGVTENIAFENEKVFKWTVNEGKPGMITFVKE